jgi:hypothetical protein
VVKRILVHLFDANKLVRMDEFQRWAADEFMGLETYSTVVR